MTKVRDHHRRWSRDADYQDAFDALGEEFDLARALIEARTDAGLSPSQLAKKMKTSQSDIARIEAERRVPRPTLFRTLRASDSHASADCLRTTRFTLIRRWRAGSIPICGR